MEEELAYPWLSWRRNREDPSALASALLELTFGIIGDGDSEGPSPYGDD
jgi:hypothetical protein